MRMTTEVTERPHSHVEPEPMPDGSDRYRIYILVRGDAGGTCDQRMIADTSIGGIGSCIRQLRFPTESDEIPMITNDDRVGILDRVERKWLINPYGIGRDGRWREETP